LWERLPALSVSEFEMNTDSKRRGGEPEPGLPSAPHLIKRKSPQSLSDGEWVEQTVSRFVEYSPRRIVCLSAESADWLWRIGAWDVVVGITAFFTVPEGAKPKQRIGGFSTAQFDEIAQLEPDLIIAYSDVQAPLLAELMRRGFAVLGTNQRTLEEIESTLMLLGRIVGHEPEAARWLREFQRHLAPVEKVKVRPRVYFEEWNDPLVSGIAWVSELIERAGGKDVFREMRTQRAAMGRVVQPEEVCRRNPEVILASWCGRAVRVAEIVLRPGWKEIAAVQKKRIYEIHSSEILQPGFRLVQGYERIKEWLKFA
jgi:iron complex transport system substrate-binding protein